MRLFLFLSLLILSGSVLATNPISTTTQDSYLVAEKTITKKDKVTKTSFFKKTLQTIKSSITKSIQWISKKRASSSGNGSLIASIVLIVLGFLFFILAGALFSPALSLLLVILGVLCIVISPILFIVWLVQKLA